MKIFLRLAMGVLLAGGVAIVVLKQNAIGGLRAEHQELVSQSQEAQRLAQENQEIAWLRSENGELEKLRQENRDLPKLRNEARQLRRQAEELESLRAENQRLLAGQKNPQMQSGPRAASAGFMAKSALYDAGLSTPEATVQTMFWAMCRGNLERLSQCSLNDSRNTDADWERRQLAEQMSNFTGFRIAKKTIISVDEVVLELQSSPNGPLLPLNFRRVGGEWKGEH